MPGYRQDSQERRDAGIVNCRTALEQQQIHEQNRAEPDTTEHVTQCSDYSLSQRQKRKKGKAIQLYLIKLRDQALFPSDNSVLQLS